MDKINTIVFDIGNVLVAFQWKEYLQSCGYSEEIIERVAKATVKNKRWKEWDRGVIEEQAMIEQCCEQDPGVAKEIIKFFRDFLLLIREYDYSASLIRQLKANGYKVYLLSNYSEKHFEVDKEYFSFLKEVDGWVISYEIKYIKPEAEIYQMLITKYDIIPTEAVFLDDLYENLEGAKPFGFHTIQVKSFLQMTEDLKKLGVEL
jgi:haloacid dehalogenase superfamily, subfamily IA, variant 3 with third motif having DD or ED